MVVTGVWLTVCVDNWFRVGETYVEGHTVFSEPLLGGFLGGDEELRGGGGGFSHLGLG